MTTTRRGSRRVTLRVVRLIRTMVGIRMVRLVARRMVRIVGTKKIVNIGRIPRCREEHVDDAVEGGAKERTADARCKCCW